MGVTGLLLRVARPVRRSVERLVDNRLAVYRMPPDLPGDVLLTFDDGPHPEHTPAVLDLLDRAGARAVFFVIGARAQQWPDLLRECERRGHILANHTQTHLDDAVGGRFTRQRVTEEIDRCDAVVTAVTGARTFLFRPPRGELTLGVLRAARQSGHRVMMWSEEGGEWGRRADLPADGIAAHLEERVRRRDVVLLHDDNPKTPQALRRALVLWQARGWDMASAVNALVQRHQAWRAGASASRSRTRPS